ncbi:MAG: hypothetical protein KGN36_18545 [Acidobacteriota bacterium]|nr:hypothetical protein [Acidobacteriota bacterium]
MTPDFTFYRVLCTSPPELESERQAFESAVAGFVEDVSMKERVLFAPASLRPPTVASRQKEIVEANVRLCEFVIAVFGEQPADPVFGEFAAYAVDCARDPAIGTRAVALCFRNYKQAAPEVRALRAGLKERGPCELRGFRDAKEFSAVVRDLLCGWYDPPRPVTG